MIIDLGGATPPYRQGSSRLIANEKRFVRSSKAIAGQGVETLKPSFEEPTDPGFSTPVRSGMEL
jgi:hypothetical protein